MHSAYLFMSHIISAITSDSAQLLIGLAPVLLFILLLAFLVPYQKRRHPGEPIFTTDPKRWGENWVGTTVRYRLWQLMTVVLGACLLVQIMSLAKAASPFLSETFIAVSFLAFVLGIVFPLCYLRALRHYVHQLRQRGLDRSPTI